MNPEHIKRLKRELSNQLFLCQTIAANETDKNYGGAGNQGLISATCDLASAWLLDVIKTYQADGTQHFDHELTDYLVESGDFEWAEPAKPEKSIGLRDSKEKYLSPVVEADESQRNWSPDPEKLDKEIKFLISSMSPRSRKLATLMDAGAKVTVENSLIYKIHKLNYLNRKVCIMAENLNKGGNLDKSGDGNLGYMKKNDASGGFDIRNAEALKETWLFKIFDWAQAVRSSTFNAWAMDVGDTVSANQKAADYFDQVAGKYGSITKLPDRPFNSHIHRLRSRGRGFLHPDLDLLSIDAGAATTQVKDESTFGRIARKLGLPERCDISGTTTDAAGAAIVFPGGSLAISGRTFDIKSTYSAAYVLCCITAMGLIGHHSLSEMATASSLASNKNYCPFQPQSLIDVLNNFSLSKGGTVYKGKLEPPSLVNSAWIEAKWQSLRLNDATPVDLEFNDRLWNTARFVVG